MATKKPIPKKKLNSKKPLPQQVYLPKIRITENEYEGPVLAFVSLTFHENFAVNGFKVVEGKKGLFVAAPSRKKGEGEYIDIAFPTTSGYREFLYGEIIKYFKNATGYEDEYEEDEEELPM